MKIARLALTLVVLCAAPAWADEWVRCAVENEYCRTDGTATVRFGAGNRWATQTVRGGVNCSLSVFNDPAPGIVKVCEVLVKVRVPQNREESRENRGEERLNERTWVKCANEEQFCRFNGTEIVKYGAGRQWSTRKINGGVKCSPAAFGGDPAVGVVKSCYIVYTEGDNRASSGRGEATSWKKCANEGGVCAFNGRKRVSYGADSRWVNGYFIGSVTCGTAAFGSDPAPGVVKACYFESR